MRLQALILALSLPLAAAGSQGKGPWVEAAPGARLRGSAFTLRLHGAYHCESASAGGFQQKAAFYLADARAEAEPGLRFAILAIPLEARLGRHQVRVDWSDFGVAGHEILDIDVAPRPGRIRRLRLPEKAVTAGKSLETEKPILERALKARAEEPPAWNGAFQIPVLSPRLSEDFGKARRYLPAGNKSYHKGMDLAVPEGSPVTASNSGTVILARSGLKAYGGLLVISHGYGLCSTYMHLRRLLVKEGQEIRKGMQIGLSGSEGISTGPHLHWQLNLRGIAIDPRPWMDKDSLAALR